MIAAWFSKAAAPLIKLAIILAIAAALALGAAFLGFKAAETFVGIIVDRVAAAVAERDAHWKSQIADANLKVALAVAAQATQAMQLNSELVAAREAARSAQEELEKKNAALPGGNDGGLDLGRVRLLNQR